MDFSRVEEFLLENLNLVEREEELDEKERIIDYIKSYDLVLKDEVKIVFGIDNKLDNLLEEEKIEIKKINGFEILKII